MSCGLIARAGLLALALAAFPAGAGAATTPPPDSPRTALDDYLQRCREGRFEAAMRRLDLPPERLGEGADLARRLKAVLDRHHWFRLEDVSADPAGDARDGLPEHVDEIARIPRKGGGAEPVRLARIETAAGQAWRFSGATVERIDVWYAELEGQWLRERLPAPLLRPGPRNLLWWQWIALALAIPAAWVIGQLLGWLTRAVLGLLARRSGTTWDDVLVARLAGPIALVWALAAAGALVALLRLYAPAEAFLHTLLKAAFFAAFFWGLLRGVDVLRQGMAASPWARTRPALLTLLPMGGRIVKLAIWGLAVVAVLSQFGFQVAGLLAGLGIGGLALALAAQKTVEHLFGSISIGVDQPFRVGDFVKVEDFVGTVEAIGLRSTRFRTLDRTLITIPNGRLADMRLESFSARDRIRLACTVGLVYGTTAAQMREVLAGLEQVLREHPRIWPDAVVVKFKEMASSSLDIEVMAWFRTPDWGEFQAIRQEVLIRFLEVVERAGTSVAFPTLTVHRAP